MVRPEVLLCLGATAAEALLGTDFSVTRHRGGWIESRWAEHVTATLHPSATLRIRDGAERRDAFRRYVEDFELLQRMLDSGGS